MAAERQAHVEVAGMWHGAPPGHQLDMDLMARVTVGAERARQWQEAREATTFHEAAAARARADSLADAAVAAARAQVAHA
jgi:hypothetical protein